MKRQDHFPLPLLAALAMAAAPAIHAQNDAGIRIESWKPISGYYDQSSLMNDEEMGFELGSLSE